MIHRAEHKDNFTTIANATIRDTNLSDGAFRLLIFMLSCSDDWDFNVRGISKLLGISTGSVSARLKELQNAGYVVVKKERGGNGKIASWTWEVSELPHSKNPNVVSPDSNLPNVVLPNVVLPNVVKLNDKEITNIRNTNNKKDHTEESAIGIFQNVRLTNSEQEELINRYGIQEVGIYIDRLSTYMNENPEKHYKNHKSTIEKWIIQDKERKAI